MDETASPKNYHHGNLRAELLDTAIEQLRDTSVEDLSLRALARAVGVSQTAPYRRSPHSETLVPRVGNGRSQPQAFARNFACEPLENTTEPRALDGGSDGQTVTLVIRASPRAELRPRNRLAGVRRIQCRRLRRG